MKKIFNIAAIAALFLGLASCMPVEPEDVFSTDPVAPELLSHNDILVTTGTTGEDVVFTWNAYRNLPANLPYQLFMQYGETTVNLYTGTNTYFKTAKSAFRSTLLTSFTDLPENDAFSVSLFVMVASDGTPYKSNTITVGIYAYGDAVAPVVTPTTDKVELDPATPQAKVKLLTWEPARLVFGEEVTYSVYMTVGNSTPVLMAQGLVDPEYSVGMDDLNEAVIGAGGAEDAEVPVKFLVVAFCESLAGGVDAATVEMSVKTYTSTFPEVLYIPGSHQGWNPATAPTIKLSKSVKGYYEGIVDLRTDDGSDVQFKFSPVPEWSGDFGGVVTVGGKAGVYVSAIGTVGAKDNIVVPSGKYLIKLNKKTDEISMVSIKSVGIIGTAVGSWDKEVTMEWDEETNVFTTTVDVVPGEYKFRLNDDWDFSIDDKGGVNAGGANFSTNNQGNFRILLNMDSHPYTVRFINTSYPEKVYLPGSHNDWNFSTAIGGNGEGFYQGFTKVGGEWGFKVTPSADWNHEQWGLESVKGTDDNGETTFNVVNGGGNIAQGSDITYARVSFSLPDMTVKVFPISEVEVVGSFTGWGTDEKFLMSYDEASDSWKLKGAAIPAGGEWKFRMNRDWVVNLGGSLDDLSQGGNNITGIEPGTYDIELIIGSLPYKAVLTKVD